MKIKIMFKVMGLLAMVTVIAFSPLRPVTEVEAQTDMKIDQSATGKQKTEKIELVAKKGKDKDGTNPKPFTANLNFSKSNVNRSRGCQIYLNNKTDSGIDLYIDGKYRGTMPKSNDTYTTPGSRTPMVVYFKTELPGGSYLYWGPHTYNSGSESDCGNFLYIMNPYESVSSDS